MHAFVQEAAVAVAAKGTPKVIYSPLVWKPPAMRARRHTQEVNIIIIIIIARERGGRNLCYYARGVCVIVI